MKQKWLIAALLSSAPAFAQVPAVPGSADVGRLAERVEPPPAPEAMAGSSSPRLRSEEAPQGAEDIKFVLKELRLDGVTAYEQATLKPYYANYIGKEISVATLYDIAGEITRRYQQDGYVLSRALVPQQIIDGNARLQVVEGYVRQVRLGEGTKNNQVLRDFVKRVTGMKPLSMPAVERMVLTLNDFSGTRAEITLEPAPDAQAGEVDMLLSVSRDRLNGMLALDNYGSRYVGPLQLTGSVTLSDTILPYDAFTARFLTAGQTEEVRFASLDYTAPLNSIGTAWNIGASRTNSRPGDNLRRFEIKSESSTYSAGVSHVFKHGREELWSVRGGIEHKDIIAEALSSILYIDRLTVLTAGTTYTVADSLGGSNLFDVGIRQGIDIGSRRTGSFDLSRGQGHSDFFTSQFNYSRLQSLNGAWQLHGALTGQWASVPLLASEEFGVGGQRFGRAYDPSEITGDQGVAALLELRYNAVQLTDSINLMPFAFYDVGKVFNLDDFGDDDALASAGVGMVFNTAFGSKLNFTAAKPLTRQQDNPLSGNKKSPRWLMQFEQRF